ncbi:hypothetical protein M513_08470 [Trichuris suis]|uniref:Uncharacterized protein n=1 Tax=Trichuris suis TaxID=68888 RepID=A0A085M0B7_9BILA|nr:hypothetical protein M513_08470 [Trichuris suis]
MLSPFERQLRVAHSKEVLELFQNPEEDFLRRIVTGDEVWLCHYDPESEQQSGQWKHVNSPRPKRLGWNPDWERSWRRFSEMQKVYF